MLSIRKELAAVAALLLFLAALTAVYAHTENKVAASAPAPELPDDRMTLILDPGHGGTDGGAVSFSGSRESALNLEIALRAEQIAAFTGIRCALTRYSEEIDYPPSADTIHDRKVFDTQRRVELINGTDRAVVVSIHQNQYPSENVTGAQVLYAPTEMSDAFAADIQSALAEKLGTGANRTAAEIGEDIYIMNNISCPAVLVECGFISSPQEELLLKEPKYQIKLSLAMISTYLQNEKRFISYYSGEIT
ncbi:MAG: N-acetylmuramoyl-L-alanine amidase [Oscillospiraceae bacterium]|nr:N-acetylmuramoyl-L-alanine amidase [Oscillospiraceae bacterium]